MEIQWPLLIFSVLLGVTSGSFVFLAVGELRGKFRECHRCLGRQKYLVAPLPRQWYARYGSEPTSRCLDPAAD